MTRPTKDEYFIAMARLAASRATCLRRRVGCVLVNARGHVLATGYNGPPAGDAHCDTPTRYAFQTAPERDRKLASLQRKGVHAELEQYNPMIDDDPDPAVIAFHNACAGSMLPSGTGLSACEAVHAEQNALLQCHDVYEIDTCYVTVSPCVTCVGLLRNTSCRRIVFDERYAHDAEAARRWAKRAGSRADDWVCLAPHAG